MGKYYCKKCGSNLMFIETKGNNTGLYCGDCGLWQNGLAKMNYTALTGYLPI